VFSHLRSPLRARSVSFCFFGTADAYSLRVDFDACLAKGRSISVNGASARSRRVGWGLVGLLSRVTGNLAGLAGVFEGSVVPHDGASVAVLTHETGYR
jgi:hypothetical protein